MPGLLTGGIYIYFMPSNSTCLAFLLNGTLLLLGEAAGAGVHGLLHVGRRQPREHRQRKREASPQRTRTLRLQRNPEEG